MAYSDFGDIHHISSDDDDDDDFGQDRPLFAIPSSEEEEEQEEQEESERSHFHFPFLPSFLLPPPHLFMPALVDLFPFGNPFQMMFELQRFQRRMTREQQRIRKAEERNRKRQLSSIATASFSPDLNEKQCVICLEEFDEGTPLKRLSCRHHYHVACIDRWLIQNGKCPLCNCKAVHSLEEVESKRTQAKKLREEAQARIRRRPQIKERMAFRRKEIQNNPANPAGKKLRSKEKRPERNLRRNRRRRSVPNPEFPISFFGGILPPPIPTFGGAINSDDEEDQIQRAIRESLRESEEMERRDRDPHSPH